MEVLNKLLMCQVQMFVQGLINVIKPQDTALGNTDTIGFVVGYH